MFTLDIYEIFIVAGGILLSPLLFALLLIWFVIYLSKRSPKPQQSANDQAWWQYRLTPGSSFVIIVLLVALVAIVERLLYDLSRIIIGAGFSYWDNLPTILLHAIVIIPLLVVSIIVSVIIGEKKKQYAVVFIPYFVTSVALAVQLTVQMAVYFTIHHTQIQFYVVMLLLTIILSYAIYFLQHRYNQKLGSV